MPAQDSLKSRKFKGWPKGPNGEPALTEVFGGDVKAAARQVAKRELSDSAMDAVFDSFVGSPLSIVADRCAVGVFYRGVFIIFFGPTPLVCRRLLRAGLIAPTARFRGACHRVLGAEL